MSADRQRLTSAIRRIAKTDPEIRGLLDASDNKGGKPGAAGVGGGLANEEGANTISETRICCDGSVNENPNPGTDERNPDDGGQDGLNPDDPANLDDNGPGELGGVTDCATGDPVCFDGGGFIPPEGWDAPDDPPVLDSYTEGTYWRSSTDFVQNGAETPQQYCAKKGGVYELTSQGHTCGSSIIRRFSCLNVSEPFCTDPNPWLAESWPSDSCVNLAVKGGTIVGSKYDPENDGSYSAPRDEIELCDPESGTRILLRASAGGGWKSIKSLAGEPDGAVDNGYLYAKDGKRIRQISPSEFRDDTV